jgi:hypothetical protein
MKLQFSIARNSLLLAAGLLALPGWRASAQTKPDGAAVAQAPSTPARITQAIDETQLVRLKGHVHPFALPEFDQSVVADSQPVTRALLLLQRSSDQEAKLEQLLVDQQNKTAANFHGWLTPEQFGKQFGPADSDLETVTSWLASHGFQNIKVGKGRTTIEFSGNVGQVRNAFHTEIHEFLVHGEARNANVSDPQIPAALTPVVAGIVGLHNFPPKAYAHRLGTFRRTKATGEVKPLFTYSSGAGNVLAVGPTDFATIYNVLPLWTAGTDGTGQSIALVGDSNIDISDVADFRTMFGLPANTPQVIVNGPDPGLNADEIEADLDVQWAGAIAKNAQIILVVTESPVTTGAAGPDLSALYIIDNNLAPVMSESFGACESNLGSTGNQFENTLWQQASAQGITVMVSSGDSGSAGCDPTAPGSLVATQGVAVSGVASTPFNVAVGGTDFNSALVNYQTTYWGPNTTPAESSALSYIPEITWNDTCAAGGSLTGCTSTLIASDRPGTDLVAGSGGPSSCGVASTTSCSGYPKPSWQTGTGVPADGVRDLPDVSLFASNGRNGSFYIFCEKDANAAGGGSATSCDLNSPFLDFQGVGGTSASSPTFAAIMALVNQKTGQRQGNANYVLYAMSKKAGATCTSNAATAASPGSCVFYDLPAGSGNISVACQGGSIFCSNPSAATTSFGIMATVDGGTTPAWNTTVGYDLATGLGSVNAANLVNTWTNVSFTPSTTTFLLNGGTAVNTPHGAPITVSGTVTGTGGTPTGIVELIQGTVATGPVIDVFTLSAGSYSGNTTMLPGTNGTPYSVIAHYGGDGTFAASDSSAETVTSVSKENSAVTVSLVTFNSLGAPVLSTGAVQLTYGSPYLLRVDVTNAGAQPCSANAVPCPTGLVILFDNNQALNDFLVPNTSTPTNTAMLNGLGFVEDQPIQLSGSSTTQNITAQYGGDKSYNLQLTSNTLSLNIAAAGTATAVTANPTSATTAQSVTLTATVTAPTSNGAGPAGTVVFSANGTAIAGTPTITTVAFDPQTGALPALTAILVTTFPTSGTQTISAAYTTGNMNYASSASTVSATVTVTTSGSFTVGGTPATVTTAPAAAGTMVTATSTITVTPSGGFVGPVTVTCGSLPGVTCSPLTIASGSTTGTLTINVSDPSLSMTAMVTPLTKNQWALSSSPEKARGKGWWMLSAGTGLATLFLIFLPGRKRYRAALGLGLVCVVSLALGCGGYSGSGGIIQATTTTKVSVANTKVGSGTSIAITVAVTSSGTAAAGNAQVFDGTTSLGTAAVAGGSATINAALTPGTHSINAHYMGDTNTQASQSGTLLVTATGNATLAITGTSGTATANGTVSLAIN